MRRIVASMIALFIVLSLCSCAAPPVRAGASTLSATAAPRPDAQGSIYSRSKIDRTLASGVVIDADVTALNDERLAAYTGAMRIFSVDEVAAALGLSPKDALSAQTDYSLEGLVPGDRVYMEFEGGKVLICNMNQFWYTSDTFLTMRDLLIADGRETNTDLFLTGNNLDFATLEQARAAIDKVLEQLEIPVVHEPLCYTLDYETVLAESERQYALALEESKDFNQQIFAPQKLSITEDDACYMFHYPVAVDGLPLSRSMSGGANDGSWMPGTELVVCYSRDGIAGLTLEYQPEMLEKAEARPLLSLEDILSLVEVKYDSLILDGEYLIYDIRLEYIAKPVVQEENRYRLFPVWRFSIEHSFTHKKGDASDASTHFTDYFYNLFDAVTGEELPIDLGGI